MTDEYMCSIAEPITTSYVRLLLIFERTQYLLFVSVKSK
jgi:hypothetical protein